MAYQFSNTPVYVSEGQTVRFKFKAPNAWDTTQSVTIQIGLQTTIWYITTIPEDFAPNPYPFTPLYDTDLDTLYVYGDGSRPGEDIITVSGLTPSTEASVTLTGSLEANLNNFSLRVRKVSQGETTFTDWFQPSGNYFVENTDEIQVRLKSNSLEGLTTFIDLAIGSRTERWTIETAVTPPNIPEPFPTFDDITNAPLNIAVYSNILQVQGLNDTAVILSTNAQLYVGVSNTNDFFVNSDGYDVLSGTTFELVSSNPAPTINNGQYLQLYVVSSDQALTTTSSILGIGDEGEGSNWRVTTGNFPSTNPDTFSFVDKSDVLEDAVIESAPAPLPNGIAGLGTNTEVDVVLVSTTGTEPRIKIQYAEGGESSVGLFPTKANNGDKIVLYNRSSAVFGDSVQTIIKVGQREINPWTIVTNLGPDTDAVFNEPSNLTNRAPNKEVASSIITITGINRPITINTSNPDFLISVDFGVPIATPVTFDPTVNTSIRIVTTTSPDLSGVVTGTVTIGTGPDRDFEWSVLNYAVAPPPPDLKGAWYSKKTAFVDNNGDIREAKEDGHAIGTVVAVFKQPDGSYGTLDGTLSSRFPGYLECDGSSYDVVDYVDLWNVIGNTYGGNGSFDSNADPYTTNPYSGQFNVPDFRNRKMVGTGVVDGNRASSAFVPSSGSVYEPGEIGGWWYVDNVDVAGDNPYEQIIGDAGGSTGTSSNFFRIGTVKTVFNAPIEADVDFSITGSVTAQVGPLLDTLVNIPAHSHLYVTALCDGTTGDPLIPWGTRALATLPFHDAATGVGQGAAPLAISGDDDIAKDQTGDVADAWIDRLRNYAPDFQSEWNQIDGVDNLKSYVKDMINQISTMTYNNSLGDGNPGYPSGDANSRVSTVITAETWWPTPYSVVPDSYFKSIVDGSSLSPYEPTGYGGTGARKVTGVIDTNQSFVRIDSYTPPGASYGDDGTTQGHSHLLTTQQVVDFTTDYTYGNQGGAGDGRVGLGSAGSALNITFNQAEVGMELNIGTFTLNTSVKKPIPDVVFSPNKKVPLVPEFHKVKYIIKAY